MNIHAMLGGMRNFSSSIQYHKTLTFIETLNGKVTSSSLSAITAAQTYGEPITAFIAGSGCREAAKSIRTINSVSNVLFTEDKKFEHNLAEELAPLVKNLVLSRGFINVVTPASAAGKSFLPRLGALLDVQPISDVVKVLPGNTFIRPIYAGNALATIRSSDSHILTSIRSSAFPPATFGINEAPVEEISLPDYSAPITEFVSQELISSERPELGSASKVVAGGRGLKNKESFDLLIEPLASKLNAAIGASRAAVDSGFCDNSLQVGQTGKIVAPALYVAVGVSGAIQHLAGMKDSKVIVAINKDPEAPIFNVADVGLVFDLTEAVPELTSKL